MGLGWLPWDQHQAPVPRTPSPMQPGPRSLGAWGILHIRVRLQLGTEAKPHMKADFSPAHAALPGATSTRAAPTLPGPVRGSRGRARLLDTLLPAALMTSDGRYVLNGDWSIAWPGPYEAAGTRLLYARTPDGTESLEAAGPTDEDLHVLVLLQEPNPGIEYEFWLPRGHPQPGDTSPLRQPQPRGAGSPPPAEPPAPTPPPRTQGHTTEPLPPRNPPGRGGAAAGRCGRCRPPKGRSQRIRHFCQSDFVFQARILARRSVGQETRYEVQVKTPYRHRFPLVPREYVWVPDACGCPQLLEGREYLLMARRHVNYEHTLNRILLQRDGYARPWSPREDRLVREAARHCAQPRPP
uniref:NTR domain-containing protein n=1 Tax=Anser cygnoides TaxID=8845 RepID=A0A8B9E2I6_ANSCY